MSKEIESLPENFEERALTIDEIFSGSYETIYCIDHELGFRRAEAWCRASSNGDMVHFAARLAQDGHVLADVQRRLGGVQRRSGEPEPDWVCESRWVLEAFKSIDQCPTTASIAVATEAIPFEGIVIPVVTRAGEKLAEAAGRDFTAVGENAHRDLLRLLLKRLAGLLAPAIYQIFYRYKTSESRFGPDEAATASRLYDNFVTHVWPKHMNGLFEERPVLLRLAALICTQWHDTTLDFIQRFAVDRERIGRHLALPSCRKVTAVSGGCSDPHNGGRSVLIVTVDEQSDIVYKPRAIDTDVVFSQLVELVNSRHPPFDLEAPRSLQRDGYGWCSRVTAEDCLSQADALLYFRRAGALLCLLHLVGLVDAHGENIIASGSQPVLVDTEAMFHRSHATEGVTGSIGEASAKANAILNESVLAVGLLPGCVRTGQGEVITIGGFEAYRVTTDRILWDDCNADRMRPAGYELMPLQNLPSVSSDVQRLDPDAFVAGYTAMAAFLSQERHTLLCATIWETARAAITRRILRPTSFYALLLRRLRNPEEMRDGVLWSIQADYVSRIAGGGAEQAVYWPITREERLALVHLDVPHFLVRADKTEVSGFHGTTVYEGGTSGFSLSLERFRRFDGAEADRQLRFIQASLPRTSAVSQVEPPIRCESVETGPAISSDRALAEGEVHRIARLLRDNAIRGARSACWIGMDWLGDTDFCQPVCLGNGLYNGSTGISLFLAAYARRYGDSACEELAVAAIHDIRRELRGVDGAAFAQRIGLGVGEGLGSSLYGIATVSQLLKMPELLDDVIRAAALVVPSLLDKDDRFDVMGGAAGCILGLVKAYELTAEPSVLQRAVACAEYLERTQVLLPGGGKGWIGREFSKPLTGFAHGAAGMAFAFSKLARFSGREDHQRLALDCVKFENAYFSGSTNNWRDLRYDDPALAKRAPCQWCYGAGGIGLARAEQARLGLDGSAGYRDDAAKAVVAVGRAWPYPLDSLCCGNLGNIECLVSASNVLQRPELKSIARRRLSSVIRRGVDDATYRWGTSDTDLHVGLFRGLSGLGYTILRLEDETVPNVLAWD